ncbi:MAG: nucleotidyltransferase family protein [Ruminococcus sp.]
MKASAIICEYNPFHNGHKYQIDVIKKNSDNPIVAIMSGNFTQRGDIALIDKFKRTEIALNNGVDLVVELPTVYAVSSAQSFAKAGVQIAQALGVTENLCFSAEESNRDLLFDIANAFDNVDFNSKIKEFMDNGDYYPIAAQKAVEITVSKEAGDAVTKANNILSVEYLKALKGTDIKPMIIERIGVEHDCEDCNGNITSASNIRKMVNENSGEILSFIPKCNKELFESPANIENLEKVILYKLRTMSIEDIKNLPDVNEGLENRIYESVKNSTSLQQLIDSIKTKRYTRARIRRIIIYAFLGITKDMLSIDVPYIRVLGFNKKGAELLKYAKLPLITNVSDGYKSLDETAKKIFDVDLLATDLYSLGTDKTLQCSMDFTNGIIKRH